MISAYELAMTLVILIVVTAVKESKKVDSKQDVFINKVE